MVLNSLNEARSLWQVVSDYYILLKNKRPITKIWQGMIELVRELKNKEDAVALMFPDSALEFRKRYWEKFSNLYGIKTEHTTEPLAVTEVIPAYWGDASIINNGYWYSVDCVQTGNAIIVRVDLSTMAVTTKSIDDDVDFHVGGFLNCIVIKDGYLWIADYCDPAQTNPDPFQPHLYKIDLDTLEVVETWEVFASSDAIGSNHGTSSGCADDEYIYLGGYETGDIIKFKISDGTIFSENIDGANYFDDSNTNIRCIIEDGDYLYAYSNTLKEMYKILKSDLSLDQRTADPSTSINGDNIVQDEYYVYTIDESGTPVGINRWKKQDLSVEHIHNLGEGTYGSDLIINNNLIILPRVVADGEDQYTIKLVNLKTFEMIPRIITVAVGTGYKCWNIMIDPDAPEYIYLYRQLSSGSEAVLERYSTMSLLYGDCTSYLLNEDVFGIENMQNKINTATALIEEGTNYEIIDQYLPFISGVVRNDHLGDNRKVLIQTASQLSADGDLDDYWAQEIYIKNDIAENFVTGLLDVSLGDYHYDIKISLLRMIWTIVRTGPTEDNLNFFIHAMAGIPFAKYPGMVKIIETDYPSDILPRYRLYYSVPVYAVKDNERIYIADKKVKYNGQAVTSNVIIGIGENASVNDIVIIDGNVYQVIEKDGDNAVLDATITDGTYDIVVYTLLDRSIYKNCVLFDRVNKKIIELSLDNEIPEGEVLMVHQRNVNYDDNGYPYIATESETLEKYIEFPDNVKDGDRIPRFKNLQKAFEISGWLDNYIDNDVAGYGEALRPSYVKAIYSEEVDKIYSPTESNTGDNTKVNLDSVDNLADGESITIKPRLSTNSHRIVKAYQDENGYWWVEVEDMDYNFRGLEQILIVWDEDTENCHYGGYAIILEGNYDRILDRYALKVDIDLSNMVNYIIDGEGNYLVTENGDLIISLIDAYVYPLDNKLYTRKLDGLIGLECEMDAEISVNINTLPIVKKAAYLGYGDNVVKVLQSNANAHQNEIVLASEINIINTYRYILIYGDTTEAELHKIIGIEGQTLTLAENLEHNYKIADNAKILLLKSLSVHNKITIDGLVKTNVVTEDGYYIVTDAGEYMITPIKILHGYENILTNFPNYQENITKVLNVLLPKGGGHLWNI